MSYLLSFNHGDRVIVLDDRGNHICRGRIHGRAMTRSGPVYDVQPDNDDSLAKRHHGVSEAKIRPMDKPELVKLGSKS